MKFKRVDQTIYITSKCWGLGGQHYHTILSPFDPATDWAAIDREKEIVLDNQCGFVYEKQEPDSLIIFLPSYSYTEEKESYRQIGSVCVKIMEMKTLAYNNLVKNRKKLGLKRTPCVDM